MLVKVRMPFLMLAGSLKAVRACSRNWATGCCASNMSMLGACCCWGRSPAGRAAAPGTPGGREKVHAGAGRGGVCAFSTSPADFARALLWRRAGCGERRGLPPPLPPATIPDMETPDVLILGGGLVGCTL